MTRNEVIREAVAFGVAQTDVAKHYGISRQRVEQIVHPRRHRARTMLNDKVVAGDIEKPSKCQSCGSAGKIEAHHHDYTQPLSVEWLCHGCHVSRHAARERRVCPVCAQEHWRLPSDRAKHCSHLCGQRGRDPATRAGTPRGPQPERWMDREPRVQEMAEALLDYMASTSDDRVPGISEFAKHTGRNQANLCMYVDPGLRVFGSYRAVADAIYERAGVTRPLYSGPRRQRDSPS